MLVNVNAFVEAHYSRVFDTANYPNGYTMLSVPRRSSGPLLRKHWAIRPRPDAACGSLNSPQDKGRGHDTRLPVGIGRCQ
jgi:hypothetical protein